MKAFTDLEQSKKLADILPLESADMYWWFSGKRYYIEAMDNGDFNEEGDVRAWSLTTLYDILPNNKKESTTLSRGGWKIESIKFEYINNWWCEYKNNDNHTKDFVVSADNPVDACYEMILKLKEQNLL